MKKLSNLKSISMNFKVLFRKQRSQERTFKITSQTELETGLSRLEHLKINKLKEERREMKELKKFKISLTDLSLMNQQSMNLFKRKKDFKTNSQQIIDLTMYQKEF